MTSRRKPAAMPRVYVREAVISYRRNTDISAPAFVGAESRICSSRDVIALATSWIGLGTVERFVAFAIDSRNLVTAAAIVGQGSTSTCPVSMSELARFALLSGTSAIIVAHNHPSGDPAPSNEDIAITARIKSALALVDVQLLDHVVVAERGHFSFLDSGLLVSGTRA